MELLDVKDAAKMLKLSEYTLRRHLRKGILPGYRTVSGWRINREALERYLERTANYADR
jgi:excisionase family DNA binding protein